MGFCEMIYHETAKFPAVEKDGLAKELRTTSMLLLRTISRDSIKAQKEFLTALDKTVDIQLDLLILLKLAFRMGFMEQRVYQTLEEDLKGLENIANEMKGMHGIKISDESIFSHLKKDEQKDQKPVSKPDKKIPLPVKKDNQKFDKNRQSSPSSRRGRQSKPKTEIPTKTEIPAKTEIPTKTEIPAQTEKIEKISNPTTIVNSGDFAGTPLYDDDDPANVKPEESKVQLPQKNDAADSSEAEKAKKRKQARGRWSLKRSVSKRSAPQSNTDKKE